MAGCVKLGLNYQIGRGVARDLGRAHLYKQACDGGDMSGCVNLGVSYANGEVVAKDRDRANTLYKQACDGGSMGGCLTLGEAYEHGDGVPKNRGKARVLLKKACDGGLEVACKSFERHTIWYRGCRHSDSGAGSSSDARRIFFDTGLTVGRVTVLSKSLGQYLKKCR